VNVHPLAHVLDKSALYGKGISPSRILLANSLRLLPLHCVERAGVRPSPFGFASSIHKNREPLLIYS